VAVLAGKAAGRIRGALRERDTLARAGRYEFVAVVALDAELPGVDLVGRRLQACLETPLEADGWRVPARASIGISTYPEHARTPESLINLAEAAMRRGRRSATQTVHVHSVEAQHREETRDERLERLRAAVEGEQFTLHFQPQFDLRTLKTTGLEALLRWHHPDQGVVSPSEFLPLIVECGHMPAVGRWVLREAVSANMRLFADGVLDVPVAVNVDAEIFEDAGFVAEVSDVLDEHGMPANRLEVELTEGAAIAEPAQLAANARALRALGVTVAMDDYGTGFSSLKRLRSANFNKLKIDRAFVSTLPGGRRDQAVIAALLDLADGLDLQAVAEGIETQEQLRTLRALGCRYGQGYLYGRPMAEDVLRTWVDRQR
jgi:EAL domain-containing protein (putative c-di-GMP-specific phosphodiesterase class I)